MVARRLADRRHHHLFVALFLVAVLGVAACDAGGPALAIPSTLRAPELVGVVESVEARSGPPLIHLVGGTTYDPTGATPIVEIGTLAAGSLFLAGSQPTPWYAHLLETVPGCYGLITRGRDDGTAVVTEVGLRLTKAPDFSSPDHPNGVYDRLNDRFCLGPDGRVTSYGITE